MPELRKPRPADSFSVARKEMNSAKRREHYAKRHGKASPTPNAGNQLQ